MIWVFQPVPCNEFVEVLASKAPVPGGGGASALVGAIGTALGNMVGSLTVGKKKYADVEAEMYELKAKCDKPAGRTAAVSSSVMQRCLSRSGQGIRHAACDGGGEGREGPRNGNRPEGCLRGSDGDHGEVL